MLRSQHVLGAFRRLPHGKNSFERWNLCSQGSPFHAARFSTRGGREDVHRSDPSLSERTQHIQPEDFSRLVKRGRQYYISSQEQNEVLVDEALGPPTAQDLAIEKQLGAGQASPAVIFRQCVDEGTANVRVVNSCMLAYSRKINSFPRRRRQQLYDEIREDGMARSVLKYLWTDTSLWHTYLSVGRQTLLELVLCSLLEGLEEVIEKWVEVEVHLDGLDGQGSHAWRGTLLRQLVKAHAYLDTTLCADSFLKAILSAQDRIERAGARYDTMKIMEKNPLQPAILHASLWPALLEGFLQLTRYGFCPREWYNTSSELYDRFVLLLSKASKLNPREKGMYMAHLDLCHPRHKSDVAAMIILENFMANKESSLMRYLDDKPNSGHHSKRVASVLRFMQHTAGVADYLEHHDKASWIRNEVMKKFEQEHGQDDGRAASNSKQGRPAVYPE